MNGTIRTATATLLSLALLVSFAAAPAAAADDGLGLGGDDGGILGGDDDGSTNESGLLGVTGTVTDTVEGVTGDSDGTSTVTDTVEGVTGGTDGASTVTDTVEGATGGSAGASTLTDALEGVTAGSSGVPLDQATQLVQVSDDQLPADVAIPALPGPGPSALPVGSGTSLGCELPVGPGDLPTETLPGADQLPDALSLGPIGPDSLTGIALGVASATPPEPCEVYDPQDPPVSLTDGVNASGMAAGQIVNLNENGDVVRLRGVGSLGDEGDASLNNVGILYLGQQETGVEHRLTILQSKNVNDRYAEIDSMLVVRPTERTGGGQLHIYSFGDPIGGSTDCDFSNPGNVDPGALTDVGSLGLTSGELPFCSYDTVGVPTLPLGPQEVTTIVIGKATDQLPSGGLGSLPVGS